LLATHPTHCAGGCSDTTNVSSDAVALPSPGPIKHIPNRVIKKMMLNHVISGVGRDRLTIKLLKPFFLAGDKSDLFSNIKKPSLQLDFGSWLRRRLVSRLRGRLLGRLRGELLGRLRSEFLGRLQGRLLGRLRCEFLGWLQGRFLGRLQGRFLGRLRSEFLGRLRGRFLGRLRGDGRDAPAISVVAFGALAAGVTRWSHMARLTIIVIGMVKDELKPVLDIVAVGALARPVALWCYVAILTIVIASMVKIVDFAPVVDSVASGTLTGQVACGRNMARLAISVTRVVKIDSVPIAGTGVTVGALA